MFDKRCKFCWPELMTRAKEREASDHSSSRSNSSDDSEALKQLRVDTIWTMTLRARGFSARRMKL